MGIWGTVGLALLATLLVACGSGAASRPASAPAADTSRPAAAAGTPAASGTGGAAPGQPPSAVLQGAAEEGTVAIYASSNLGKEGAAKLEEAFNQKYGLHATIQYTASSSMTRDASRAITEISAGQPPTWDLMMLTDAHYATFVQNGVLEPVDWTALGLANRDILAYDGAAINFVSDFVAPAYNPNVVPASEAPKDWPDLLDPKWRGKIGVSTATHHWARLAQAWGDERTTRFMESLAAQQPILGQTPELYNRLTIGEIAIDASIPDTFSLEAKNTGAPFVFVDTVKPLIATNYDVGLLKGVQHPNLAKLLAVFMTTPEGQAIWDTYVGGTSMFIEGTPMWRYAQGKDYVALDAKFAADQLDDLTEKYGRMVGFR
ncbi:MAG TPA: extracellular solute-binding protein [Chloroflexota bacterium]|nr:extracellular solute-binding protein [Chloroflexota bacterium]